MDFFLNPWYMAAGGALISSPILIHLINRMRFKRIRWAAMEFLLKSQKRNRRRLIIEQLILLLLRILLVLLAAFLLARYLYSGATDQEGTKHFVLLDDTLSMSDHWKEEGKYVSAFDKGKEELLHIAKEASKANSAQEMIVYVLSDLETPVFDARLNTSNIEDLNNKLEPLKPTALHLSPATGIEMGHAFLTRQPQGQKILHYIGDFRENKWVTGAEGERTTKAVDQTLEAGINVSLMDVAHPLRSETKQIATNHDNLAITDVRAETRIIAEGIPVEFTVSLFNYSNSDKKTHMKVFVDGKEDFNGSKDTDSIKAGQKREEKFTLVLAKKKPVQDIRTNDPPDVREQKRRAEQEFVHLAVEIDAEETGLQADNYRDMVIEVRKKVPALLIDGNDVGEGTGPGGDVFHVGEALSAAKAYDVERRTVEDLDKIDLNLYPSIYFLNVRTLLKNENDEKGKALVVKLADYVRRGGSLAFFLGPKVYVPFYNDKLHKEQNGLFPVLLQQNPTPPLPAEEREERKKDEQPKIIFRIPPQDAEKQKELIRSSDPTSIIVNLAGWQGGFRYLLIDRYHPAVSPREDWDTNPNEKVQDLIVLPNRKDIEAYKGEVQERVARAIALSKDLAATNKEYEIYATAIERHYFREVRNSLQAPAYLFNVAAALDRMLHDPVPKQFLVDNKDEKPPSMSNVWAQPTMRPLRDQIVSLIDRLRYGDPLVVARPYGKGRVVACLTTAGTSSKWNDWGAGSSVSWTYVPFMMDLQRYLTSSGDDLNRLVGDKVDLQLDSTKYANKVDVRKVLQPEIGSEPKQARTDKEREPAKAAPMLMKEIKQENGNRFEFKESETKKPGLYIYELHQTPGDTVEERKFTFNVDAQNESDLRRASREKLERNLTNQDSHKGKIILREMGGVLEDLKNKAPDASESPWLYLLILVILVVEQALAVHLSFHLRGDAAATMPAATGGLATAA